MTQDIGFVKLSKNLDCTHHPELGDCERYDLISSVEAEVLSG